VLIFDHEVNGGSLVGIVLIIAPTAWLMAREHLPRPTTTLD
jgi:hypothetical protein